jgi:hypothetical protein
MMDSLRTGRPEPGALVRLTTPILDGESDADAAAHPERGRNQTTAPAPSI